MCNYMLKYEELLEALDKYDKISDKESIGPREKTHISHTFNLRSTKK